MIRMMLATAAILVVLGLAVWLIRRARGLLE
jgi:hypothetical protein